MTTRKENKKSKYVHTIEKKHGITEIELNYIEDIIQVIATEKNKRGNVTSIVSCKIVYSNNTYFLISIDGTRKKGNKYYSYEKDVQIIAYRDKDFNILLENIKEYAQQLNVKYDIRKGIIYCKKIKTSKKQQLARDKWNNKNKEKRKVYNYRSTARLFIKQYASKKDIEELYQLLINREIELATINGNVKM